jgi:ATP-binding cassette subfamily C protein CydCD
MRPVDPATLPYLRPARAQLIGVVAASFAQSLLVIGQAFAVAAAIVAIVDGRSAMGPLTAIAATAVGRAAVGAAVDWLAADAAARVGAAVRRRLLAACVERGPVWLGRRRAGELVALSTRGTAAIEPYLTRYLPALVTASILPTVTLVAMASQDLLAAFIVLVTLPLLPLFAALIGMTTKSRADRQWRALAALAGHFLDVVRGLPTLVTYRRARAQAGAIRAATERHRVATLATLRLAFASSVALELVATLSVALVAVSVGLRLDAGHVGLHPALVALLLAPEAYWPIRRVGAEFHAAAEGAATFAAVTDIVEPAEEPATHRPHSRKLVPICASADGVASGRRIDVDDLSVAYPGAKGSSLRLDRASIRPGRLTVVTGPSGSGKSTLLLALMGYVEADTDAVKIDGTPLNDLRTDDWRRQVAWLPQRPWFAPGTVADNVRLGRADASDDEIWHVLREVGLTERIAALPGGLSAQLAEDGRSLSAGERARLAIARVLLADRPISLLDEPTAHVDDATQAQVMAALRRLAARSTVVLVSHRDDIIAAADQVIQLQAPAPAPRTPAAIWAVEGRGSARTAAISPDAAADSSPSAGHGLLARLSPRARLAIAMLIGAAAATCGVALTATSGWLIVRASERPPVLTLLVAIVAVRTFGIGRPVLRYAERLVSHDAALRVLADVRVRTYESLIPLTPGRLGRRRGDLLASVVDDVDAVVDRSLRVWLPVGAATVVCGSLAAGLAPLSWVCAAVATAALVAGGLSFAIARRGARRGSTSEVAARAELSSQVSDLLDGAGDVAAWGSIDDALAPVDAAAMRLSRAALRAARHLAAARAVVTLAAGAGVAIAAAAAADLVSAGDVSPAVGALLALVPMGLLDVVGPLADAGALEPRTRQALDRLRALQDTPTATPEPAEPTPVPSGSPTLRLDAVSARWDDADVVLDASMRLDASARIAVMGPSGSGKSTLAALIARHIDPSAGSVSVAEADLRGCRLDDVRRTVGFVDDDPHVFGSTVFENLRLARPAASREDAMDALERVRLHEWVAGLPDGLDTVIGDGSAGVSGGERARIALARALLADQPILVLDEPTAHLDGATARAVVEDALLATSDRAVVLITHRVEDATAVDAVARLTDDGALQLEPTP